MHKNMLGHNRNTRKEKVLDHNGNTHKVEMHTQIEVLMLHATRKVLEYSINARTQCRNTVAISTMKYA